MKCVERRMRYWLHRIALAMVLTLSCAALTAGAGHAASPIVDEISLESALPVQSVAPLASLRIPLILRSIPEVQPHFRAEPQVSKSPRFIWNHALLC